ncbi:hypothetical protein [Agrobacterium pusense]|uniref:hypothetical protein n=1 Tax=Agrobacterium pusense TaxID=648995 RepID=UPI002FDEAAED
MMKKSEKLARELVALTETYSEKEFAEAIALLRSGKLFRQATSGAATAINLKKRAEKRTQARTTKNDDSNDGMEALLGHFPEGERNEIRSFSDKLQRGDLFPSNVHLRAFAEEIGVNIPQKTPNRRDLVARILSRFLILGEVDREQIVNEASKRSTTESSLKRWSSLIVKKDGSN